MRRGVVIVLVAIGALAFFLCPVFYQFEQQSQGLPPNYTYKVYWSASCVLVHIGVSYLSPGDLSPGCLAQSSES